MVNCASVPWVMRRGSCAALGGILTGFIAIFRLYSGSIQAKAFVRVGWGTAALRRDGVTVL